MRATLCTAVAAITLLPSATALGQEMPRYDPAKYCRDISDFGGGSAMIYNSCVDMEQAAYDKQKRSWASVSIKSRSYCDEIARFGGGSYSILESCVGMEAGAAASPPAFRY